MIPRSQKPGPWRRCRRANLLVGKPMERKLRIKEQKKGGAGRRVKLTVRAKRAHSRTALAGFLHWHREIQGRRNLGEGAWLEYEWKSGPSSVLAFLPGVPNACFIPEWFLVRLGHRCWPRPWEVPWWVTWNPDLCPPFLPPDTAQGSVQGSFPTV